jgi:hypothetical protein
VAVWDDIMNAVGESVRAVASTPVVVRESGETLPGDTYPMWLVCSAGEEEPVAYAFTALTQWQYPVGVLYVAEGNRDFEVDPAYLDERERVRQQIDQRTLTNVSTVFDATPRPLPISTYGEAPNSSFRVSGFLVTYDSFETRTNG